MSQGKEESVSAVLGKCDTVNIIIGLPDRHKAHPVFVYYLSDHFIESSGQYLCKKLDKHSLA